MFFRKIFSMKRVLFDKIITIFGFEIKINSVKSAQRKYGSKQIVKNRIVFNNFAGNGYGCNPKYIAEEILRRKLPYELIWLSDNKSAHRKDIPAGIKIQKFGKSSIPILYSAKVFISNIHANYFLRHGWIKGENQKYIQTWHGSLGIKKLDFSVKNLNPFFSDEKTQVYKCDMQNIDFLLSNSTFEEDVFKEGLLWDKVCFRVGHPRNDIFFKTDEELDNIRQKVFSEVGISGNKKILLYAPSYRDDYNLDVYVLNYQELRKLLNEKSNDEWVILVRFHRNLLRKLKENNVNVDSADVIDVTSYPDIQELLVAADIGITDYSSWIFDFMLSRKPGFIFATDIEKYNNDRGFYYPLETTPFPIATDMNQLVDNIINFDMEKYRFEVDQFLASKGCMEDGHASERVVDLIEKIIEQ